MQEGHQANTLPTVWGRVAQAQTDASGLTSIEVINVRKGLNLRRNPMSASCELDSDQIAHITPFGAGTAHAVMPLIAGGNSGAIA
jgi:hypothetical protein